MIRLLKSTAALRCLTMWPSEMLPTSPCMLIFREGPPAPPNFQTAAAQNGHCQLFCFVGDSVGPCENDALCGRPSFPIHFQPDSLLAVVAALPQKLQKKPNKQKAQKENKKNR